MAGLGFVLELERIEVIVNVLILPLRTNVAE
jgi:hypothetical protein